MPWSYVHTACIFYGYEIGKVNPVLYHFLDRHTISKRALVLEFCKILSAHCLKDFIVNKPALFAISFRVPGWSQGVTVKVNENKLNTPAAPGTWARIERTWNPDDRLTVQIPMALTTVPIDPQHPHRVAFRYGPVVLVRTEELLEAPGGAEISHWITPAGRPLEFRTIAQSKGNLLPFYRVGPEMTYRMYFDFKA